MNVWICVCVCVGGDCGYWHFTHAQVLWNVKIITCMAAAGPMTWKQWNTQWQWNVWNVNNKHWVLLTEVAMPSLPNVYPLIPHPAPWSGSNVHASAFQAHSQPGHRCNLGDLWPSQMESGERVMSDLSYCWLIGPLHKEHVQSTCLASNSSDLIKIKNRAGNDVEFGAASHTSPPGGGQQRWRATDKGAELECTTPGCFQPIQHFHIGGVICTGRHVSRTDRVVKVLIIIMECLRSTKTHTHI